MKIIIFESNIAYAAVLIPAKWYTFVFHRCNIFNIIINNIQFVNSIFIYHNLDKLLDLKIDLYYNSAMIINYIEIHMLSHKCSSQFQKLWTEVIY